MGLLDLFSFIKESDLERLAKQEATERAHANADLAESIRDIERDLLADEAGWRAITGGAAADLSRFGLRRMIEVSQAMYLTNPLIKRAVNVRAYYTWGQGCTIRCANEDVQERIITPHLTDPLNLAEWYSHQSRILTDVDQSIEGNTFFALFTSPTGEVAIRSIPTEQITAIVVSDDDYQDVRYYRREWTTESGEQVRIYPAVTHPAVLDVQARTDTVDGTTIQWDAPVAHLRTGGTKRMRFGVPETFAALDWARANKQFVEDWHSLVASLTVFAWKATAKPGKAAKSAQRLGALPGTGPGTPERPAAPGSVAVMPEGTDLTPIPKSGATTSIADAKASRLMVGAAMDLPDTILSGDVDQGNLATAKTLDRPTELAFDSRQKAWAALQKQILEYVVRVRYSKDGAALPDDALDITVSFPSILEHDMRDEVAAIVSAATLDGKPDAMMFTRDRLARLLAQALGIEDPEQVAAELPDLPDEVADAVEALRTAINEIEQ